MRKNKIFAVVLALFMVFVAVSCDDKPYHVFEKGDFKYCDYSLSENNNEVVISGYGRSVQIPFEEGAVVLAFGKDDVISESLRGKSYKSIEEAYNGTKEGDILVLLGCSKSNNVNDEYLDGRIWRATHDEKCNHKKNGLFASGYGTKIEPYMIANKEQFLNISKMYETYAYYKIDDSYSETDLGGWPRVDLHGSFDGNGKTFTNVTDSIFRNVGKLGEKLEETITLKNFKAVMNVKTSGRALVGVIANCGTTVFENITVSGSIAGKWNIGSFYNYGTAQSVDGGSDYTVEFVDCLSNADLICFGGGACGGFIGHGCQGDGNTLTVNIDDKSDFTGTIYTLNGGGNKYIGMEPGNLLFNGNNKDYRDDWNKYNNTKKLNILAPNKNNDGKYQVEVGKGVERLFVSVNAQLNGYESDGKTPISNLQGITLVLKELTFEKVTPGDKIDILGKVASVRINNNAKEYGYDLSEDGGMTVNIAQNANYLDGKVYLTVVQYGSNGEILYCGNTDVFKITK